MFYVIDIFFGCSLGKVYCAKFHHCKMCVTDNREGGGAKMHILNRVKDLKKVKRTRNNKLR